MTEEYQNFLSLDWDNSIEGPVGYRRFAIQIDALKNCIQESLEKSSENTVLNVYQTSARQWTFYIEALCRLYKKLSDKKFFKKIQQEFKEVEDQLGRIDYYDGWLKKFSSEEKFDSRILAYWEEKKKTELKRLKKFLDERKWLSLKSEWTNDLFSTLQKVKWKTSKKDAEKIADEIVKELREFEKKFSQGNFQFSKIETGLHEFRRQLRWFSIYAQALDGLIQLRRNDISDPELKSYMTEEVIQSPYNKLPEERLAVKPIFIEEQLFYALSWLINELGKIKDAGLCHLELARAKMETQGGSKKEAVAFAASMIVEGPRLNEIPAEAESIADTFMNKHRILKRIRENVLARER